MLGQKPGGPGSLVRWAACAGGVGEAGRGVEVAKGRGKCKGKGKDRRRVAAREELPSPVTAEDLVKRAPGVDHLTPLVEEGMARNYAGSNVQVVLTGQLPQAVDIAQENFVVLAPVDGTQNDVPILVYITSSGTERPPALPKAVIDLVRTFRGNTKLDPWGPALPLLDDDDPAYDPTSAPTSLFVLHAEVPYEYLWGTGPVGLDPPPNIDLVVLELFRAMESVLHAHADRVWAFETDDEVVARRRMGIELVPMVSQGVVPGAALLGVTYDGGLQRHWILPGNNGGPQARGSMTKAQWETTMGMAQLVMAGSYQGRLTRAMARIEVALSEMRYADVVEGAQQVVDMALSETLWALLREDGWTDEDARKSVSDSAKPTMKALRKHFGAPDAGDWQWGGSGVAGELRKLYDVRRTVNHEGKAATRQQALDAEAALHDMILLIGQALLYAAPWHPCAFAYLMPLEAAASLPKSVVAEIKKAKNRGTWPTATAPAGSSSGVCLLDPAPDAVATP